jgi:lycopene beta-cyclase
MRVDLVLVGGGLANSLIAFSLKRSGSPLSFVVVERGSALGGNHTWSFHQSDLTAAEQALLGPFVSHTWAGQDVKFPGRTRTLHTRYHSIRSSQLHDVVMGACGDSVLLQMDVVEVRPDSVALGDGRTIAARGVIDGRGFIDSPHIELGYQKFLGQVLELSAPHRLERPILMDATVDQRDGYRFLYVLPFSDRRILVEDTCYSEKADLPREFLRAEISRYAERTLGVAVAGVSSEEEGVLPVVLDGDIEAFWNDANGIARSGLRAALFHPTTGYSLGEATRFAVSLARGEIDPTRLFEIVRQRSLELWRRGGFFRLLNRMLFRAAVPEQRYRVLERFYGLPEPLIERFYAGKLTRWDQVRLLTGRPPVPIGRALRCLGSAKLAPPAVGPRS